MGSLPEYLPPLYLLFQSCFVLVTANPTHSEIKPGSAFEVLFKQKIAEELQENRHTKKMQAVCGTVPFSHVPPRISLLRCILYGSI